MCFSLPLLNSLTQIVFYLLDMVGRFKATDASRLRAEYNRLVDGLAQRGNLPGMLDAHPHSPILETEIFV